MPPSEKQGVNMPKMCKKLAKTAKKIKN